MITIFMATTHGAMYYPPYYPPIQERQGRVVKFPDLFSWIHKGMLLFYNRDQGPRDVVRMPFLIW